MRALMASIGAKIVARDAVDFLIEYLSEHTIDITKRSLTLAKHANRKKITKDDIQLAVRGF
ncbi:MAG: histone-like protein [Candidatus Helarchaeota archaeon]